MGTIRSLLPLPRTRRVSVTVGRAQRVPDVVHVELNRLGYADAGGIEQFEQGGVAQSQFVGFPGAANKAST